MKTLSIKIALLLIIFTSLHCIQTKAQGNTLQFNQVILVTTTQTVPPNKVWKVESVIGQRTTVATNISYYSTPYLPATHSIVINGVSADIEKSGWGSLGIGYSSIPIIASSNITSLPIWLPTNATLAAGSNVTCISVIEFNIVP